MPRRYGKRADTALDMWVKLARAFSVFSRRSEEQIRSFGLTPAQFSTLECLGHKGTMTLGELCKKQLVSGGNMTVVVDHLERDNLVERVRSRKDRRSIAVRLTPRGKGLFGRIFPSHARYIADVASVLTQTEQTALAALLKKLGKAVAEEQEKEVHRVS